MRTALHRMRIQGGLRLRRLYRDRGTPFPRGMPRSSLLPGERLPALRPMPGHPLRHADRLFLRPGARRYAPWGTNRAVQNLAQGRGRKPGNICQIRDTSMERQCLLRKADETEYIALYRDTQPGAVETFHGKRPLKRILFHAQSSHPVKQYKLRRGSAGDIHWGTSLCFFEKKRKNTGKYEIPLSGR